MVPNNFGYNFAITFNFGSSTYTVWQASLDGSQVVLHNSDGATAGDVSNPWNIIDPNGNIASGWTTVDGNVNKTFSYTTGLNDFDGLQGGNSSHNVISGIDLSFLEGSGFYAHLTYGCGNDNLIGYDPGLPPGNNMPIPGSLLLLGSGLAGLSLTGFRRRKRVG